VKSFSDYSEFPRSPFGLDDIQAGIRDLQNQLTMDITEADRIMQLLTKLQDIMSDLLDYANMILEDANDSSS
jgi:hypothetical protein